MELCRQLNWESYHATLFYFRYGEQDRDEGREKLSGFQLFIATFKHIAKPYQILIIPLTFWSGVEQGFFGADFTAVSYFTRLTMGDKAISTTVWPI